MSNKKAFLYYFFKARLLLLFKTLSKKPSQKFGGARTVPVVMAFSKSAIPK